MTDNNLTAFNYSKTEISIRQDTNTSSNDNDPLAMIGQNEEHFRQAIERRQIQLNQSSEIRKSLHRYLSAG